MTGFLWRRGRKLRDDRHVAGWWTEMVLGEDRHGVWAVQQPWTPTFYASGDAVRMADAILRCYPRDRWWVATFYGPDRRGTETVDGIVRPFERLAQIYVDMAVPARHDVDGVSFVDLTLDVVDDGRGGIVIDDVDEVEAAAARWGTPPSHVERARRAAEDVHAAVVAGTAPFDGATARCWAALHD